MKRIAAVIALIVLPMATFAQAVVYAANHPGVPGHAMAQWIVGAFAGGAPVPVVSAPQQPIGDTPLRRELTANAPQGVTLRPLGPVIASSPQPLSGVKHLVHVRSDGRVMISDLRRRVVFLMSPALTNAVIVIDSAPGKANSWGTKGGGVFPFRGDSTLYFDGGSNNTLVLDPNGKLVRNFASPRLEQGGMLTSASLGMIYSVDGPRTPGATPPVPAAGASRVLTRVDLFEYLLGVDPTTHKTDTLATLYTGTRVTAVPGGQINSPLPTGDTWTVMADQTIAIVRGREYRVDWIGADRKVTQGPRLLPDWKRLTDADKARIADSINTALRSSAEARIAKGVADSTRLAGAGDGRGAATAGRSARSTANFDLRNVVPADDIPDYLPPMARNDDRFTIMSDFENNLWIQRREKTDEGGFIYDVANRQGRLIDRVGIPVGKTLLGFQPGGFALLVAMDGGVGKLEKARIR